MGISNESGLPKHMRPMRKLAWRLLMPPVVFGICWYLTLPQALVTVSVLGALYTFRGWRGAVALEPGYGNLEAKTPFGVLRPDNLLGIGCLLVALVLMASPFLALYIFVDSRLVRACALTVLMMVLVMGISTGVLLVARRIFGKPSHRA